VTKLVMRADEVIEHDLLPTIHATVEFDGRFFVESNRKRLTAH
jgi:hypothetical protein